MSLEAGRSFGILRSTLPARVPQVRSRQPLGLLSLAAAIEARDLRQESMMNHYEAEGERRSVDQTKHCASVTDGARRAEGECTILLETTRRMFGRRQ